ncbi:MAG: DUF998 domain-containing protein [Promethearchaeota archaeon]
MSNHEKIDGILSNIDERIDDFLDYFNPIYRRISGNYLGLIGVFIASISITIAFFLYMTVDPSFSPFTHWISQLGIGPNGANLVFNIGISISSVLIFFFYIYHIRETRKRLSNKFIINLLLGSVIVTCVGLIFVAIFPYNIPFLHGLAANVFFFGGMLSCLLYSIMVLMTPKISKIQALIGFFTVAIFLFHIINSLVSSFFSKLEASEFDAELTKFSEWLALFAILFLILENIVYSFSDNYRLRKQAQEFLIDCNYHMSIDNIYKLRKFVQLLKT